MSPGSKETDKKATLKPNFPASQIERRHSTSSAPSGATRAPVIPKRTPQPVDRTKLNPISRLKKDPSLSPASTSSRFPSVLPKKDLKSKFPNRSPVKTRSLKKNPNMALTNFISITDKLIQFEARVIIPASEEDNIFTYEIRRDRLQAF
ncbi:hypothetical protein ACLKA6_017740 [Drosophila palustris]